MEKSTIWRCIFPLNMVNFPEFVMLGELRAVPGEMIQQFGELHLG